MSSKEPRPLPTHTPEPWKHNGNAVHKRVSPHFAECICVCEGDNRHANAALIARAPELLADNADHKQLLRIKNEQLDTMTACNRRLRELLREFYIHAEFANQTDLAERIRKELDK
jgi:hypothetical protein